MLIRPMRCALLCHKRPIQRQAHSSMCRRLIFVTASAKGQAVMVVESPTKATKIQKFLGDEFKVLSSYGHIRDLPSKAGSVLPEEDFRMLWGYLPRSYQRYREIEDAVREADRILLATDPDREGEAISWHITQELQGRGLLKGRVVQRVTFTEITQLAVARALQAPREVSAQLVDAYLARRALDYLVGFNISPLLWRKLQGATSAGRVQSVALRLCCEREVEASKFNPEEYWSIAVQLGLPGNKSVTALLSKADGEKMGGMAIKDEVQARALASRITAASFQVSDVQSKLQQRQPAAPFITSTLQQEASRRLGFGASWTMATAQALYEGSETGEGLITYMRTDGVQLSSEAVHAVRSAVSAHFGPDMVPKQPRMYKSRAKNAQEAHEAIRPTKPWLTPDQLPAHISSDQRKLYRLIWERTLASQMTNAVIEQMGVDFTSNDGLLVLRATGSSVKQPGYLMAYDNVRFKVEGETEEVSSSGTPEDGQAEASNSPSVAAVLAGLKVKQAVSTQDVQPAQHFTRPPPRYTEASLIKALEELGIGRPSTYAPTLRLLQTRGYINKEGRSLAPTSKGLVLTAFMQRYFRQYIDYSFTSKMEEKLDEVSEGTVPWKNVLRDFWGPFQRNCEGLKDLKVSQVVDMLDEELQPVIFPEGQEEDSRKCPMCQTGRLHFKPSKFGGFVGCSNFDHPEAPCSYARPLHVPGSKASSIALEEALISGTHLGYHPASGQEVLRKKGPYGPYLELGPPAVAEGDAGEGAAWGDAGTGMEVQAEQGMDGKGKGKKALKKPKKAPKKPKKAAVVRAPIPKGVDPESITLEQAVKLLEATIPQSLGTHPEDGAPVFVKTGRYGPYVQHQQVLAPLPKDKAPESITLEEAVELVAKKAARMASRGIKPQGPKAPKSIARPSKSSPSSGSSGNEGVSKRKASGYMLFCQEQRPAIVAANADARPADIMKLLAAAWQGQGEAGKAAYNARASSGSSGASAVTATAPEAAAKGSTSSSSSSASAVTVTAPEAAAKQSASSSTTTTTGSSSTSAGPESAQASTRGRHPVLATQTRRGRQKSTPLDAPANSLASSAGAAADKEVERKPAANRAARSANPYIRFCSTMRPQVKAAHPDASPSQIMQLLAEEWRKQRGSRAA